MSNGSSAEQERWERALKAATTKGASAVTAAQDGLPPGVASSQAMARTDMPDVRDIQSTFDAAASQVALPAALLAAIASRESRVGKVLAPNGTGDGGDAFGIMQVDYRHHDVQGEPNPKSLEHVLQASTILKTYLDQVNRKFPAWSDANVLKGAAVAYNSGVGNVQTITGMNNGTTGNDYGDDVIARSQYYQGNGI